MSSNTHWKRFVNLDDVITAPAKTECEKVCEAIVPFFTPEAWDAWVDAGPDDNAGFLAYAKAEWQKINDEFTVEQRAAAEYGERLPPVKTWAEAMTERDKDFNRRYFNNPDGKPEWRHNG